MKTLHLLLAFILVSSLFVTPVLAGAGLLLPAREHRIYFFEPGAHYEWEWYVHRSDELSVYLGGDLEEYATLHDPAPGTGPRYVTFEVTLPDELPPGEHLLILYAEEAPPDGAMVGGVARAAGKLWFISLFPSPYVDVSLEVTDTAQGNDSEAHMTIESWSQVTSNVYVEYAIQNTQGDVLKTLDSSVISLASKEEKILTTQLPVGDLPAGNYLVKAKVRGAQDDLELSDMMRIGSFELDLDDYTNRLPVGKIGRFEFSVSSNWNQPISDVSGELSLLGVSERSPSVDLEAFGSATTGMYIDLSHINKSQVVRGDLTLRWENGGTQTVPVEINVSEDPSLVVEEPGFVFALTPLTGLYLLLILLVIFNVVLLFKRKK